MTDSRIIKILISCPGDVTYEKEQIIRMCKDFSDANHGRSNIAFMVLDWRDYVGEFGTRGQQQLKEYFGVYDVYIGLLWKRFGTPPGSINPNYKENESGTEEEFYDAIEYQKNFGRPKIHFFIKTYDRDVNDLKQNEQIGKVFKFIEEQKKINNNYLNSFNSNDTFNSSILKLLLRTQDDYDRERLLEEKENFVSEETKIKIADFKTVSTNLPKTYIERSTSHFKLIKDKLTNPFLVTEHQSLDQLMISTKRVVLLGDAGSGKSTELKNLHKRLSHEESPFVPILQKFNSYTPDLGLEDFLPDFWKEVPSNLLLIIWDGLDEIEPKNFNTVVRQINTFSEKHREIRILVSCRTNFYELPINDSNSTLPGFEPYLINDLNLNDVKDYYDREYSSAKSDDFIREIFDNNLSDVITKPFFLMLLADRFNQDQRLQLNRAELYEMFLFNRIELDQNHFKTTVDLRSKKQEILLLLQNVALSMEILSKNQIKESEILSLITSVEFNSLKYCTAFKKKDGEEDIWQFEHNNIQEFLAAKALSNLEFEKVVQFIAFAPNYEKLIPSWVNTLAFIFSILDPNSSLFEKLLHWMLKNEKETLVKFESDKVAEDLRVQIFQGIFKHYKTHDVWISSNKFSDRELARFGQSESNLHFLIEEIKSEENTKTVHINAIRLLGHFKIEDNGLKSEIEKLLLEQIDRNMNDPDFIHTVIYSLKWAGFTKANTIEKLMKKVGSRKNQYIRAAIYAILLKSEVLEEYVNYLIEGYELTDKKISGERDDVSLMDEEWNLKECVKSIKTPKGIKEIVEYISESTLFKYGYDSEKVIEAIITNAVGAYEKDTSVFNSLLNWFKKDIRGFRLEKTNLILQFFNLTNTREKAFHEIWTSKEDDKERNKSLAISKLITPELIQFVIDEYLNRNLTNKELEGIYFDMGCVNNENREQFEKLIHEKTDFVIKKPEQIDHEALRKEKLKVDLNLLFDQQAFKEATIGVFEKKKKEVLSFDELFEMRKENNRWVDIDEYYPSVALRLLRDFVNKGQFISKEKVIKWFERETNEEWYRISLIYNYLTNHKDLEINSDQRQWIQNWCTANVSKVNFKEAIEVHEDGRITIKTMAMYIWYLSKRYNIDHPKDALLDMLSFDFFEGNDWVGIEYIVSKLDHKDIVDRMLENIKEGIADSSVLKNHIKYLAQNKVKESYPFILNVIINLKRSDYRRKELLDMFFEYTKDTESIKTIIDQTDSMIRWAIIDKLKANNQESFVEEYLLKTLEKSEDDEEIGKTAEILVSLQNIQGLKKYVEWIKNNVENDIDTSRVMSLNSLKTTEAIPYLIELLELSYIREIKVDRFDRFNSQVLGSFYNIALVSDENFELVKSSLQKFMTEKYSLNVNIKYILHTLEKMEEQFYMNNSQSFTIEQVKEKLKLIQL
jgi:energy-coupling factor transporter ATP-binding protein EcfA2